MQKDRDQSRDAISKNQTLFLRSEILVTRTILYNTEDFDKEMNSRVSSEIESPGARVGPSLASRTEF